MNYWRNKATEHRAWFDLLSVFFKMCYMAKMIKLSLQKRNQNNCNKYNIPFTKHKDYVGKPKNDIFIATKQTWQRFHNDFLQIPRFHFVIENETSFQLMTIAWTCLLTLIGTRRKLRTVLLSNADISYNSTHLHSWMDRNYHWIGGREGEVKTKPIFCQNGRVFHDFCLGL